VTLVAKAMSAVDSPHEPPNDNEDYEKFGRIITKAAPVADPRYRAPSAYRGHGMVEEPLVAKATDLQTAPTSDPMAIQE
jgi:hypothetical protein